MAIDEADQSGDRDFSGADGSAIASGDQSSGPTSDDDCRVGAYSWADFMEEYGYGDEVDTLYPDESSTTTNDQLGLDVEEPATVPTGDDWDQVSFDPDAYLGYHPDELQEIITERCAPNAKHLQKRFLKFLDPTEIPATKDLYLWQHLKQEYGNVNGKKLLGFDPATIEQQLNWAGSRGLKLDGLVDERTVNVREDLDEDEFFSTAEGGTTVTNRYDLEKAVPFTKKRHFREEERYWVNEPYAFVILFHSEKENEKKYYVIEPYLTEIETELQEFLAGKLRTAIKYSDDEIKLNKEDDHRRSVIERETRRLLNRYDLFENSRSSEEGLISSLRSLVNEDYANSDAPSQLEGMKARPEPAILEEDPDSLTEYQVEKILYLLKRNFIGYERIDGIKHDINVEDISCDGYNSPVFVYHGEYEQIISNVYHGEEELDNFVVKLAQRSGKGISKRMPQVDATLPDGSRSQLTLGQEVSDHGTNYTIRQFKDVPFTPVDLINWNTFSLDEMAFLWLAIENHKSLIFAGGTASGKTTSLNAVSLFIPSNSKIVSIEDTREVELPQRNWIASVTRPSFSDDSGGDVDEFDLLEAALRQRPDYIVMGEIRGEEGRTLFQVMSTGHTTYTTFHADSVDEVLKRFTTDPINVSKTMFTALDLVSIQTQTRVQGRKVRRNKSLTEINHYEAENDEINVQDVYQWQAETDEYLKMGDSNTLETIKFDRGWTNEKLEDELFKRRVILAYLIKNGLNTYAEVAATIQAFINDSETILTLIANNQLEESLDDLRQMESVLINVDQQKEEQVPRPDATDETYNLAMDILERAEESMFEEYRGKVPSGLGSALSDVDESETVTADQTDSAATADQTDDEVTFSGSLDEEADSETWDFDDTPEFDSSDDVEGTPSWLEDESDFGTDDGATAEATQTGPGNAAAQQTQSTSETPQFESNAEQSAQPNESAAVEPTDTGAGPEAGRSATDEAGGNTGESGAEFPELEEEMESGPPTGGVQDNTPSPEPEDSADEEIGRLFDDMDRALDDVEGHEQSGSSAGRDGIQTGGPDTSDFDTLFPERNLESVFGSDENEQEPSDEIESQPAEKQPDPDVDDEESIFKGESESIFSGDANESRPDTGSDAERRFDESDGEQPTNESNAIDGDNEDETQ